MASNYFAIIHNGIEVFRCRDCEKHVKSMSHECDDLSSVFTDAEIEAMKNNG